MTVNIMGTVDSFCEELQFVLDLPRLGSCGRTFTMQYLLNKLTVIKSSLKIWILTLNSMISVRETGAASVIFSKALYQFKSPYFFQTLLCSILILHSSIIHRNPAFSFPYRGQAVQVLPVYGAGWGVKLHSFDGGQGPLSVRILRASTMATSRTVPVCNSATVHMGEHLISTSGRSFGLRRWGLCPFLFWDRELPADQLGVVGERPRPGTPRAAPDHRSGGMVGTGCCWMDGGRLRRARSRGRDGLRLTLRLAPGEQYVGFCAVVICGFRVSVKLAERNCKKD